MNIFNLWALTSPEERGYMHSHKHTYTNPPSHCIHTLTCICSTYRHGMISSFGAVWAVAKLGHELGVFCLGGAAFCLQISNGTGNELQNAALLLETTTTAVVPSWHVVTCCDIFWHILTCFILFYNMIVNTQKLTDVVLWLQDAASFKTLEDACRCLEMLQV